MKRFVILLIVSMLIFSSCAVPVLAADDLLLTDRETVEKEEVVELSGFIPSGYKYYFCERYSESGDYYICFYKNSPLLTSKKYDNSSNFGKHYRITDAQGDTILYYRFSNYDNMIAYLFANDASGVDYVYERDFWTYAHVDTTSDNIYYSNFDIVFSDTENTYYSKHAYSKSETNTYFTDDYYFIGLSVNDLYNPLIAEFIAILPIVLSVIVVYLSVRKAISFVLVMVKGG